MAVQAVRLTVLLTHVSSGGCLLTGLLRPELGCWKVTCFGIR